MTATERAVYDAREVARMLGVATPTVYEHARKQPREWGVVHVGRSVRFRKRVIDELVDGGR